MTHQSVLIKPVSSVCNIRCKYCFYEDVSSQRETASFGKMSLEMAEQLINRLLEQLSEYDELTVAFQGGEPTLAGLSYYEHFVSYLSHRASEIRVHYSIQTNGMIITRRWCEFFKKHNFLVGLSIDGTPIYHDLNRLDMRGKGTFHRVLQTKKLFDAYGIRYNILCVLTNALAKEPKKVYQFLKSKEIAYIQFIPCLDSLDRMKRNAYALTPQRFANFYKQIFRLWLEDLKKGDYRSIKLFDDIYNLFVFGQETACGLAGACHLQQVVEADGSVYPCDFYALDQYRLGNLKQSSFVEMAQVPAAHAFLNEPKNVSSTCQSCPFKAYCYGGCKRMSDAMYVDYKTKVCGYQQVLTQVLPKIGEITAAVKAIQAKS